MGPSDPVANDSACPREPALRDFSRGLAPAAVAEAIERHLEQCGRCGDALAGLAEDPSDADGGIVYTLRRTLREPSSDLYTADPECRRMTEQAKRLLHAGTAPVAAPALPLTLGVYELVEKIGEGGMGSVYRALHTRLRKPVAVKVLRADRTADPAAVARFQREMTAIGRLDHPHLVRATDAGTVDGVHFLVMELIDGINLAQLVSALGALGIADGCAMIRQAALGLAAARGLVHRDLKPSNLLLTRQGEIKVLDLGLARLQHEEGQPADELTAAHQILGTGDYMAPEQWLGSHGVDVRADIYSLGCTLYFLLTGTAPFAGQGRRTPQQKMAAHLHDKPPLDRIDTLGRRGLRTLFERMLAKDAAERHAEPAELAAALGPFCTGADLSALALRGLARPTPTDGLTHSADSTGAAVVATPHDALPVVAPRRARARRGRWMLVAGGAALVLGVLAAAPFVVRRDREPPTERVLQPGRWNDLLDHKPTEWHWFNPAGDSHFGYDDKTHRLFVQTTRTALLGLGTVNGPGFTLQLGIRQEQWTGGVGVFFAGRKEADTGILRYQYLELIKTPPQGAMVLRRGQGSITPRAGQTPLSMSAGGAGWQLPQLPGPREYVLEISVTHGGLGRVSWDGALCKPLIDRLGEAAPGRAYQGEFGLYCAGCSVQLIEAKIMPLE